MPYRRFGFRVSDFLYRLFQESPEVVVGAWGSPALSVVEYITFTGKLKDGGECAIAYGGCGFATDHRGVELRRLVIRDPHLRALRHFMGAANGEVDLDVRLDTIVDGAGAAHFFDMTLTLTSGQGEAVVVIGHGDFLRVNVNPHSWEDRWSIGPNGELEYVCCKGEKERKMPAWLELALGSVDGGGK
jgi:hypothetical protein